MCPPGFTRKSDSFFTSNFWQKGDGPSIFDIVKQVVEVERSSAEKVSVFLMKYTISFLPGLQMAGTAVLILILGVVAGQG